jgi:hypothetical protein
MLPTAAVHLAARYAAERMRAPRWTSVRWLFLALALALAGCGSSRAPAPLDRPSAPAPGEPPTAAQIGYPGLATKNTARVAGVDATSIASAVAQVVYPGQATGDRPPAVALTDGRDWRTALAASVLMSAPIKAPLVYGSGTELPATSEQALRALAPTGSSAANGAQLIRVGDVANPRNLKSVNVRGAQPFAIAAEIDRFLAAATGKTTDSVLVVSADDPAYAEPAAGYAAKSGTPILFVKRDSVPAETKTAINRHQKPHIYVLGPPETVSDKTVKELGKLGTTTRAYDSTPKVTDPVTSAIAFTRLHDATFGWFVRDAGHGLVFTSTDRPLDAAAAAPLSATGTYGPLIPIPRGGGLPKPLQSFLLDIEPGYSTDPVRGVYNRGWLIGDTATLPLSLQAGIDRLMEIAPVRNKQP